MKLYVACALLGLALGALFAWALVQPICDCSEDD